MSSTLSSSEQIIEDILESNSTTESVHESVSETTKGFLAIARHKSEHLKSNWSEEIGSWKHKISDASQKITDNEEFLIKFRARNPIIRKALWKSDNILLPWAKQRANS